MSFTNRKFGVEIEGGNLYDNDIVEMFKKANITLVVSPEGTSSYKWGLDEDCSIDGYTWNSTFEIKSPILRGQDGLNELRQVANMLHNNGGATNVTCGLHVHQDTTNVSAIGLYRLNEFYRFFEPVIDNLMEPTRKGSINEFCKPVRPLAYSPRMAKKSLVKPYDSRYSKINYVSLHKFGTVEFRHHHGTLDGERIVNWVRLTQAMMEKSKDLSIHRTTVSCLNSMIDMLELDDDLKVYWTEQHHRYFNMNYISRDDMVLLRGYDDSDDEDNDWYEEEDGY